MEGQDLKVLIKKRASLKTKLTNFEKYVNKLECSLQNPDFNTRETSLELEQRTQNIELLFIHFDELQNDIEFNTTIEIDKQFEEREEFENKYYSLLAKAKKIFEILNPTVHKNHDSSNHSVSSQSQPSVRANPNEGVKLPEIKLPKFDGSYQTWLEFRDTFESLIHDNQQLSTIQKFHYLRASLIDAALQVIQSIEFSAANYHLAWKALCERFNNTNLLVQNHVRAIFQFEAITEESAIKIRNLSDNLFKHLTTLKQLGEPTDSWDTLIIYIITRKLDSNTAQQWERYRTKQISSTLDSFRNFLKEQANLLETLEINRNNGVQISTLNRHDDKRNFGKGTRYNPGEMANVNTNSLKYSCFLCKKDHSLFYCPVLLKLSIKDRISKVKKMQLCVNCLRRNHTSLDCKWSGCKYCGAKHNSILHYDNDTTRLNLAATQITDETKCLAETNIPAVNNEVHNTNCTLASVQNAILSTTRLKVRNSDGTFITARALLDCGSQSSFITKELCEKLKIPTSKVELSISGIGNKTSQSTSKCSITISSTNNSYICNLICFVLPRITSDLPDIPIDRLSFDIPNDIELADPDFHKPQPIDILIGADIFWQLIRTDQLQLGPKGPILQNTHLGWIVTGPFNFPVIISSKTKGNFSKNEILQNQLSKFWEIEETTNKLSLSPEEAACEKHFQENLAVSPEGRYIVSLPLKASVTKLGDSKTTAIRRFNNLERKLASNNTLRLLYTNFLSEYEALGHMTKTHEENDKPEYFMPHHGILKETSKTTRLRVVFDASAPTTTGISLNHLQMVGPTIQNDLLSIILRFRVHTYVLSSDIKMMYRQVLVHPNQRDLQKIVWRSDPSLPLTTYKLNTVTYGTTAASFLAIRCLHEVAKEYETEFPTFSKIIKNDMYVDDLLTGANTREEASDIAKGIFDILNSRGFELRKWKSNDLSILNNLHIHRSENVVEFSTNKDQDYKTLGLVWESDRDLLAYRISPPSESLQRKISKRKVLSIIASIFDPLGLVSPCIIIAKVLMQRLWLEKIDWDETIPDHIFKTWFAFSKELSILNTIEISRHVTIVQPNRIELHGFADASESSYGACIYVLSKNSIGEVKCNLLCAKSKVAPLKSLTMPRLELCAGLVLAQLISKVSEVIGICFDSVHCWSDSMVVLGWLRTSANLLKPFVNHRVAEIQSITSAYKWRYVPSKENPADLVSRGVYPRDLIHSELWWHGPKWLLGDQNLWPITPHDSICELPELRTLSFTTSNTHSDFPFENFSSLNKLRHTVAFMLRFARKCLDRASEANTSLSVTEINDGFDRLIRIVQQASFPKELKSLRANRPLPSTSKLLSLSPILDNRGLIRVGGRLRNSSYNYDKRFPILLPSGHHLTKLILKDIHLRLFHAGPQLLLSSVREKYWPIAGRNIARQTVKNCITCARYNTQSIQPIMGDLPVARVERSHPFSRVGVDYCGPFLLKDRSGRGSKVIKCWVSVFVCFSTKAIHLGLVMSLSTQDFLQAFKRFMDRRGKPSEVFSDNGTNFVRANKDLHAMYSFLIENQQVIEESSADLGIKWTFIPANSPHFGGLWEAGVKAVKYHLKRVLGSYTLFFFDFQTLLVHIEAVLNSRPLCPLSSNPDDLSSLTPAHFLIGRPLTTIPEPSYNKQPENRLTQYQLVQKIREQFWNRWQREYIGELQQRRKWNQSHGVLTVGQLVLIKENSTPPMKWRLGRITKLIPGNDGVARVARVKTTEGETTRAIVRLCPLPVESPDFQGGGHVAKNIFASM